jgi:hypothetical protein
VDIKKAIIFYISSLALLAYCVYVLAISYKMAGVITIHELGLILFGITLASGMLVFTRAFAFTAKIIFNELKRVI